MPESAEDREVRLPGGREKTAIAKTAPTGAVAKTTQLRRLREDAHSGKGRAVATAAQSQRRPQWQRARSGNGRA
eukprot:6058517-Prymnesium_polylepis.1